MADLANYLLDNYGECDLGPHLCRLENEAKRCPLRSDGHGRFCKHWRPLGANNLEEQFDTIFGKR